MCVGLPAKVEEINDGMAIINAMGAKRKISVQMISDIKPGDYVMIHAGIAIAKITSDEAEETNEIMKELYEEI